MADYLEAYAARFQLPVRTSTRVDRISREDNRYVVVAGNRRWEADQVVVAPGAYQRPRIPALAADLDPSIIQLDAGRRRAVVDGKHSGRLPRREPITTEAQVGSMPRSATALVTVPPIVADTWPSQGRNGWTAGGVPSEDGITRR